MFICFIVPTLVYCLLWDMLWLYFCADSLVHLKWFECMDYFKVLCSYMGVFSCKIASLEAHWFLEFRTDVSKRVTNLFHIELHKFCKGIQHFGIPQQPFHFSSVLLLIKTWISIVQIRDKIIFEIRWHLCTPNQKQYIHSTYYYVWCFSCLSTHATQCHTMRWIIIVHNLQIIPKTKTWKWSNRRTKLVYIVFIPLNSIAKFRFGMRKERLENFVNRIFPSPYSSCTIVNTTKFAAKKSLCLQKKMNSNYYNVEPYSREGNKRMLKIFFFSWNAWR